MNVNGQGGTAGGGFSNRLVLMGRRTLLKKDGDSVVLVLPEHGGRPLRALPGADAEIAIDADAHGGYHSTGTALTPRTMASSLNGMSSNGTARRRLGNRFSRLEKAISISTRASVLPMQICGP